MLCKDAEAKKLAIGLMSGTSADGIDAVLVEISGCSTNTHVRQMAFVTLPFTDAVRSRILQVAAGNFGGSEELCLMNFLLGKLSADACLAVCAQAGVDPRNVAFVGSHGQTVFHAPVEQDYLGYKVRGTLQIGEASMIVEALGCPVVSDFRVRDMAAGGLGAPLVPYTEYLLYRQQDRTGDVAAVVLVLLPHIQDDDFLGVHHLFGLLLGDLLVAICGVSSAPGQQQKR